VDSFLGLTDPDPLSSVADSDKIPTKKSFAVSDFFCLLFWVKVHLNLFSWTECQNKSQIIEIKVCLSIEYTVYIQKFP
jgi:hypothetical protein